LAGEDAGWRARLPERKRKQWKTARRNAGDGRRAASISEMISSILCHQADWPEIEAIFSLISATPFEIGHF
jgi:hypothetical protein